MALSILRLSSSFPEIFGMSPAFTFENIVQMLQIHDTLNHGCYKAVTKDDFDKFEKKKDSANEYQLYCRRNGSDGTSIWEALEDAESAISSSTEIYFKKRGATGKDDADYVQLYSLIQLDPAKFNEAKSFKHDPATYVASLLYATCCMHKKMMELYMADIEAINDEQKEMNEIMNLLKQMQEDLAALDAGVTDETKHNKAPLDEVVLKFFLTRGLLDTNATQGVLTKDVVEELKAILFNSGKPGPEFETFKQWSTFSALLGEMPSDWESIGSFLRGDIPPQLDSGYVPYPSDADLNPFSRRYWRKASEVKDDPFPEIRKAEDHWIFSPYLRDREDHFYNLEGNTLSEDDDFHLRRPVFETTPLFFELEDFYRLKSYDGPSSKHYPVYDLRWYGKEPPKDLDDFWRGMADLLRKDNFLPETFPCPNYDDRSENAKLSIEKKIFGPDGFFTDAFKDYMFNIAKQLQGDELVAIVEPGCKKVRKIICTYKKHSLQEALDAAKEKLQPGEYAVAIGTIPFIHKLDPNDTTLLYTVGYLSRQAYWPIPDGSKISHGLAKPHANAYEEIVENAVNSPLNKIQLNSDQVTTWTDTLRIYCDRISNESSSQSSQMNTELQYSQQFLNTATQLLAKLNRMMTDIASHIH